MNIPVVAILGWALILLQPMGLQSSPYAAQNEAKRIRPVRPNDKTGTTNLNNSNANIDHGRLWFFPLRRTTLILENKRTPAPVPAMSETKPPEIEADEADTVTEKGEYDDIENDITLELSTNDTMNSNSTESVYEVAIVTSSTTESNYVIKDQTKSSDGEQYKDKTSSSEPTTREESTPPPEKPSNKDVDPFHHITKSVHLHWGTFVSNIRDTAIKMWRSLSERMEESLAKMPIILEEDDKDTKVVESEEKVPSRGK